MAVSNPVAGPLAPPSTGVWSVRDERVLSGVQRAQHAALCVLWAFVVVSFWRWWLAPAHRGALGLYLPATAALGYLTTVLPSLFWFFVARMRRPVHVAPGPGRSVALITLCVPSHETIEVIAQQLVALTRVSYPHDSWVLDEGGEGGFEQLAHERAVRYFTRSGVPRYNELVPPFQARVLRRRPRGMGPGAQRVRRPRPLDGARARRAGPPVPRAAADGLLRPQPHAVHHRLAHELPHGRRPRGRRVPAHPRRGPSRHDRACRRRVHGRVRPGGHRPRGWTRGLRHLPRPAVRLGVFDGADLPAPHAPAGSPLHAGPGVAVPDGAELVPAVVALAGHAVDPPDRGAAQQPSDSERLAVAVPRLQPRRRPHLVAHVVVDAALVPAGGHRVDLARSGARGGALADRPLGGRQRAAGHQAALHDHAEGHALRQAGARPPAVRPIRAARRGRPLRSRPRRHRAARGRHRRLRRAGPV